LTLECGLLTIGLMNYSPKNIFLAVILVALIPILVWSFGWYQGKVSPSEEDMSEVMAGEAVAYFAGGCFWCTESDFEKLGGVASAVSGYMGGDVDSPSYVQVSGGGSGHREVVKVTYNPNEVSYRRLALDLLKHTDPTDDGGSFYDRGHQYTSALYYQTEEEKSIAEAVVVEVDALGVFEKPIVTSVEPARTFWIAEDYHQDYYKKNPRQYQYYRTGSGRDAFIQSAWGDGMHDDLFMEEMMDDMHDEMLDGDTLGMGDMGKSWMTFQKPSETTLRNTLTDLQYYVTQKEGTETPFKNEYWDNHEDGVYVDVVSGEPLFSSTDKYDSGTGWPSFLKPLDYSFVTEHKDYKLFIPRTEIRSTYADSHLGHIILDGPIENDKIRYCMNSASLRFVLKKDLESEGLGEYLNLFN